MSPAFNRFQKRRRTCFQVKNLSAMNPLVGSTLPSTPAPWAALDDWSSSRRNKIKWPPVEQLPPLQPDFDKTIKSFDEWSASVVDRAKHLKLDDNVPPFQPSLASLPPLAADTTNRTVLKGLLGSTGCIVALIFLKYFLRGYYKRTYTLRGLLLTEVVVVQPDVPSAVRGQADAVLLHNELPPSYTECASSSINQHVSKDPVTSAHPKDAEPRVHKQHKNVFVKNARGAERGAMVTSPNPSGADSKDRVVYVDDTDSVNVKSQK